MRAFWFVRKSLLYFKYCRNWLRSSQFLSALAGGAAADFEAEFAGFKGQFAVIVIKRHHFRGDGEFQNTGLACFEKDPFETDEVMEWDNGRGLEIAQVKLGNFG